MGKLQRCWDGWVIVNPALCMFCSETHTAKTLFRNEGLNRSSNQIFFSCLMCCICEGVNRYKATACKGRRCPWDGSDSRGKKDAVLLTWYLFRGFWQKVVLWHLSEVLTVQTVYKEKHSHSCSIGSWIEPCRRWGQPCWAVLWSWGAARASRVGGSQWDPGVRMEPGKGEWM